MCAYKSCEVEVNPVEPASYRFKKYEALGSGLLLLGINPSTTDREISVKSNLIKARDTLITEALSFISLRTSNISSNPVFLLCVALPS